MKNTDPFPPDSVDWEITDERIISKGRKYFLVKYRFRLDKPILIAYEPPNWFGPIHTRWVPMDYFERTRKLMEEYNGN